MVFQKIPYRCILSSINPSEIWLKTEKSGETMKKTTVAQVLSILLFFSSSSVFSQATRGTAATAGIGVDNTDPFGTSWLAPPEPNPAGIADPTADRIELPQVDTSSSQSDNKVELKIKNSAITVIAPGEEGSTNLLQSGSGNTADITVDGPKNTVFFTQLGNSILTMTITNNTSGASGNKVIFNEFGGTSGAIATVDLNLVGDNNQIQAAAIAASVALSVSVDLDLNITGSDNVIALGYDDFSTIALTIAGGVPADNRVSILQDNEQASTASTDGNTATISLTNSSSATFGYEVLLRQNGIRNAAVVTLNSGDNGSVRIYQDGDVNTFTFSSTQTSSDSTPPTVDLDAVTEGNNNTITITAAEGDEASQVYPGTFPNGLANRADSRVGTRLGEQGTDFDVSVRGNLNNVDLEGVSSLELRIYGNSNIIAPDVSSSYFQTYSGASSDLVIDLFGDSNELYYKNVLVSSLNLGIDTSSNNVYLGRNADASDVTGLSAASSTFDIDIGGGDGNTLSILGNDAGGAGTVDVDITGTNNTVAMVYGGHDLTYEVAGDDFNTQVTYNAGNDNYSHTITNLGEGSVVLDSIDGKSCVFNSSNGSASAPTGFCGD
jgi:hypothetical protein